MTILTSIAEAIGRRIGRLVALLGTRQPRVLMVEGNPDVAFVLAAQLRAGGYRVEQREWIDGEDWRAVVPNGTRVISIGLPPDAARDLTWYRQLRAARPALPLLVVTASAPEALQDELSRDGLADLLLHPVEPEAYLEKVDALALLRRQRP